MCPSLARLFLKDEEAGWLSSEGDSESGDYSGEEVDSVFEADSDADEDDAVQH
jgi:hypothetical protein